jgi:O-antigen ligase
MLLGLVRGHIWKSLVITSAIIFAGLIAVSNLSYLSWRINVTEIKMYQGEQDNQNGMAIRLFMWKTAAALVSERPMSGYGLKGARHEMLKKYEENNFTIGITHGYHSHNQYLESALMAGVPALLLLVLMMMNALWRAAKSRNLLLLLIVLHFVIQSVFESTFEVQHELVFYIFFIFLFYYHASRFNEATDD